MAADGRIDIYSVLRNEWAATSARTVSDLDIVRICTSARFGKGPTLAEIRAGDYSNFPYIRRRGPWKAGRAREIPLLWDPEPDDNNKRLVGFSSALVWMVSEDELRVLLEESGP